MGLMAERMERREQENFQNFLNWYPDNDAFDSLGWYWKFSLID